MTTNGNSITSCVSLVILGTGKLLSHVASKSMTTKYSYSSISFRLTIEIRDMRDMRDVSYHLRVESWIDGWITQIYNKQQTKVVKEGEENGWNNNRKKIECAVRRCWLTVGGFSSTPTTLPPPPLREFTVREDFMFRVVVVVVVVVILLTDDNEMERWRRVGGSSDKGCYPSLWFLRFEVRPNSGGD